MANGLNAQFGMAINQNKSMLNLNIGRKYTKPVLFSLVPVLK